MMGLTSLEVYKLIFNKTQVNNKFEPYIFPDSKNVNVSYEKLRDEIERDLDITNFTATDLQNEILGPFIFEEYIEQVSKE